VRRLKEDIREVQGGFPKRIVERVAIDGLPADAPELVLSRLLDEYRTAREERFASTSRRAKASAACSSSGFSSASFPLLKHLPAASRCTGRPLRSSGRRDRRQPPMLLRPVPQRVAIHHGT